MAEDKLTSHHHNQHQQQQAPLKKIANNLANTTTTTVRAVSEDNNNNNSLTCNPCKESQISNIKKSRSSCATSHCSSSQKAGVVNLAFVDNLTEQSSWYQPHLGRDLAVRLLADSPVGTFIVRNSRTQGAGHLALSVRVPRTYNTAGILHYLIMVTEAGFRIKGFSKVFSSLSGLVVHHSVMMESLPCRLLITSPTHHSDGEEEDDDDRDSDFADLEADPEYPGLLSRLREQLSSDWRLSAEKWVWQIRELLSRLQLERRRERERDQWVSGAEILWGRYESLLLPTSS